MHVWLGRSRLSAGPYLIIVSLRPYLDMQRSFVNPFVYFVFFVHFVVNSPPPQPQQNLDPGLRRDDGLVVLSTRQLPGDRGRLLATARYALSHGTSFGEGIIRQHLSPPGHQGNGLPDQYGASERAVSSGVMRLSSYDLGALTGPAYAARRHNTALPRAKRGPGAGRCGQSSP